MRSGVWLRPFGEATVNRWEHTKVFFFLLSFLFFERERERERRQATVTSYQPEYKRSTLLETNKTIKSEKRKVRNSDGCKFDFHANLFASASNRELSGVRTTSSSSTRHKSPRTSRDITDTESLDWRKPQVARHPPTQRRASTEHSRTAGNSGLSSITLVSRTPNRTNMLKKPGSRRAPTFGRNIFSSNDFQSSGKKRYCCSARWKFVHDPLRYDGVTKRCTEHTSRGIEYTEISSPGHRTVRY